MNDDRRSHRRCSDPEDYEAAHVRQVDTRPIKKLNDFISEWKLLWFIGVALVVAFGFDFKTPGSQFEELHEGQETFNQQLVVTNRIIAVLVFLRCEDIRDKQESRGMAELDLNCSEIFKKLPNVSVNTK